MGVNNEEEEFADKNNVPTKTTLATIESLTFPLVQEVVLLADLRCQTCQDRVADVVSRLNGEAESMEISLMEKRVTLTLTRRDKKVAKMPEKEFRHATVYKNRANKNSLIKRIFRSSSG